MEVTGGINDLSERELSKIQEIFYPKKPNVILKGFSGIASAIIFRADVLKASKKRKSKNPRREVRFCMLQYLAEIASKDLMYLFSIKGESSVQYLLFYKSEDDAEKSQLMLDGKNLSTQFGPTQMYSKSVTDAHKMNCVPPPAADCYQFMLKRLQLLNLTGRPTPKQLLRSIYHRQRKRHTFNGNTATPTSSPANNTTGLLESQDDESSSDSALSNKSSRTDPNHGHESPRTMHNSLEPIRAIEDEAIDISTAHYPVISMSLDQSPTQTTMSQLDHEERTLQLRYWGLSKDTDLARCTMCALEGHVSRYCPSLKCPKCDAFQEHSSDACPINRVCTNCRERGHRKEDCPAKLARTSADGFICHLCNQKGHVEEMCSSLWRSYEPSLSFDVVKVDNLLVGCYQCGLNDHWGDDCKVIPKRKTVTSTNNVFSTKSANVYLSKPMELAINTRLSTRYSHKAGYSSEEDDQNFFNRNKKPKQNNNGTIKIKTASTISNTTSQINSEHQSRTHSERRNLTANRHRPYPLKPSHAYTDRPQYRQELPVDTYWRSGSGWQPPLPTEPLPSPSSTQEMAIRRSYRGQHKFSDKQRPAQQHKGHSYSRNSRNY